MAKRPYLSARIDDLEQTFEKSSDSIDVLYVLALELEHRSGPRAKVLAREVKERIDSIKLPSPPHTHQQSDQVTYEVPVLLSTKVPIVAPAPIVTPAPVVAPARARAVVAPVPSVSAVELSMPAIRLNGLIEFAKESARLRATPIQVVSGHREFYKLEESMQGLPGVAFNSGPSEEDELWLRLDRLQETRPPVPDSKLLEV
jgi:hypothetical protein